ncbi:hypothetical protein L0156_06830 [bacterium]|nr:hypothetical protein [bacterium]
MGKAGRAIFWLAFYFSVPVGGFGQAWISPKHTGTITLSYQYHYIDTHAIEQELFKEFLGIDGGRIRSHSIYVNVDYSFTDQLALSATIPYVGAKYEGGDLSHDLETDSGSYHPSFQDLTLELRYNTRTSPFMITPFIGYRFPTHRYEFFAHSAIGARLSSFRVGTYLGRRLDPLLPDAYVQGHYSYDFVQRVQGINLNRSNFDAQFGYFLTPSFTTYITAIGTGSHGGVNPYAIFDKDTLEILDPELWPHHDRVEKIKTWNLGGGAAYAINDSWQAYVTVLYTSSMRNGHPLKYQITTGVTWSFGSFHEIGSSPRCTCWSDK